jgi:hypothetical protein
MRGIKLKFWRAAGVAAALSMAACGGEAGEAGGEAGESGEGGEAGEAGASAPAPSAATATAPTGGEAGEAGAASAYAGLSGDQRTALRLQHLKGFVLAADRVADGGQAPEAGVLVQQGVLEVYDVAAGEFGTLNADIIRAAGDGDPAHIAAAEAEIERAMAGLEIKHATLAARLVDIATGLYQGVVQEDFVDPIEYQHSMGAALAAQGVLRAGESELRGANARAYRDASEQMTRFAGLWAQVSAPEAPASYSDVLAQASRVRLALYPYL